MASAFRAFLKSPTGPVRAFSSAPLLPATSLFGLMRPQNREGERGGGLRHASRAVLSVCLVRAFVVVGVKRLV